MLRIRGRNRGRGDAIIRSTVLTTDSQLDQDDRSPIGVEESSSSASRWLENTVLGGESEFWKKLVHEKATLEETAVYDDVDKERAEGSEIVISPQHVDDDEDGAKKPAWEDEDDKTLIEVPRKRKLADVVETIPQEKQEDGKVSSQDYVERLKKRFDRTAKATSALASATPAWADLGRTKRKQDRRRRSSGSDTDSASDEDDEDDQDPIDDLTRRTGSYVAADTKLPKSTLQFKKLRDATSGYRVKAILTSVEFHKQAQVLLVSGCTQKIQIYQIDGKDNPMLQSVTLDGFPIESAHFSSDGNRVFAGSGLHEFFYYYDLMSGKVVKVPQIRSLNFMRMANFVVSPDGKLLALRGPYGNIHLLSAKTFECISTLKMNGNVNALEFSSDGSAMYSIGEEGEVYVWDVRNRICAHRFYDDGCVRGICLATSSDDKYLATGSNTGVVNVYEVDSIRNSQSPKPVKAIMNLTTSAKCLRFNPTGEMLAFASGMKAKQLRLFHTRSRTTFNNFPAARDNLNLVQCSDFSPGGGYMCVGCENGRALLYRILHYGNY